VAQGQHFTVPAITRECIALRLTELPLRFALQHLGQSRFMDVSQSVAAIDVVIAGEEITVVFEHGNFTACFAENTQRMIKAERWPRGFFEILDHNAPAIPPNPLVENFAEKCAELIRRGRERADAVSGFPRLLYRGQETDVLAANFAEKAVYREGCTDIMAVHDTEYVRLNAHFAQKVVGTHRLRVRTLPTPSHSVAIVQFCRAVEAEPNLEILVRQKPAELFVQKNAVGLDAVSHAPACRFELSLQVNNLPEEAYTQSCGLSAMPGKINSRPGRGCEVLRDILLQKVLSHLGRAGTWIEIALVAVIAVPAIEVAQSARRFDKDLKTTDIFAHSSIPNRVV